MMEEKVLQMKESMNVTLQTLRENTRLIEQYKIRMQTMKIRIAIEQKVKDSFEAAKFQERHQQMELNLKESLQRQQALQVQVAQIRQGWKDYFAEALREIKDRFESINSKAFQKFIDEQKRESDRLDRELEQASSEVQGLELDICSTTSTQATDEDGEGQEAIVQLKFQAEQKLIRFRTLLNRKSVLYAELLNSARILMDMNDQLILNEE